MRPRRALRSYVVYIFSVSVVLCFFVFVFIGSGQAAFRPSPERRNAGQLHLGALGVLGGKIAKNIKNISRLLNMSPGNFYMRRPCCDFLRDFASRSSYVKSSLGSFCVFRNETCRAPTQPPPMVLHCFPEGCDVRPWARLGWAHGPQYERSARFVYTPRAIAHGVSFTSGFGLGLKGTLCMAYGGGGVIFLEFPN